MNWLNLETRILHAPEYIGSDPTARATWLNVLIWAATRERSGRELGAKCWGNRQWQQTCGVTKREVLASSPLLTFEGDDLVIWGYPIAQESEIKAKREAGRIRAEKRWNNDSSAHSSAISSATLQAISSAHSSANAEGKGIEKERKEKEVGQNEAVASPALSDSDWLDGLSKSEAYAGLDVKREHAKMTNWCATNHKQPTRRRFVNWLNRCEKPMHVEDGLNGALMR